MLSHRRSDVSQAAVYSGWLLSAVTFFTACFADGGSTVTGHVYDTRGNPINGARVTLEAPGQAASPDGTTVDDRESREDGCYHVFGMHAPGRVRILLTVTKEGYKPYSGQISAGRYANDVYLARTNSSASSRGEFLEYDLSAGGPAPCQQ